MDKFTVFPAIDLRQGRVVRLQQGDPARQTEYSDDPAAVARRWLEGGAEWLHLVNLDGAMDEPDSANQRATQAIFLEAQSFGRPIQFGGGLRTLEQVALVLAAGVERAILGTAAVENPEIVARAVQRFGMEHIAVSLDARQGIVQAHGWLKGSGKEMRAFGQELASLGLKTLIFTNVARDGTGAGVDIASSQALATATGLQVIASGGVNSLEEIRQVRLAGLSGVIIGRALYEGSFSLEEALKC